MSEPVYFVVERRAGCETPSIIVEHLPADVKRNAVYKLRLDRLPDAERWLAMTTAELYRTYCYMRDRGTLPTVADPRPKKGNYIDDFPGPKMESDMGVETTITCDQCEHDLTYTGNCEDYRLVLGNESLAPWYMKEGLRGGAVTSMAIAPPVDRKYVFCGIGCLAAWLAATRPNAISEYERLMKHREWLAGRQKPAG